MKQPARPTIGVLVAWPVYYGTDIQRYLHATLQGIRQAAIARGCNLLLACGMDEMPQPRSNRPAWPTLAPNTTFVPVGPWNTDGLIVSAIDLTPAQERYLGELAERGHPILYAGFVGPGTSVHLDNANGVEQALIHLRAHGHRRVAFIAGRNPPSGESAPRLDAYLALSQSLGMELDPRLIAHGDLLEPGGRRAMQQILDTGAPFSAVLACNDSSAFGAAQVLREHGLRIPQDVALIGFDNLLETSAFDPPLTTVHNPAFSVGKIALDTMWEMVHGGPPATDRIQAPVRLLVRRSCGCRAGAEVIDSYTPAMHGLAPVDALADELAATAMIEARLEPEEKRQLCRALVTGFSTSVLMPRSDAFMLALHNALQRSELAGDGAQPWRRAFARLSAALTELLPQASDEQRAWATDLILRARQLVSELAGQASTRALLHKESLAITLGLMSSQMLAVMDLANVSRILAEHMPQLGVNHILAARFLPEDDDEVARSEIVMRYEARNDNLHAAPSADNSSPFVTRHFPPPGLYPEDRPWQLALLPLDAQDAGLGFVALDAANLEPSAAIVRSLAAVMRAAKLYGDALHGREQAEEANRLKGRFLSTVSHELRTPLNLIVGLSELLLRNQPPAEGMDGSTQETQRANQGISPGISPETSSDLARIYVNAQHLARLIGDVLDLASSDAGQLRVLRETLDAGDLLRSVATTGEQMAREKGLDWRVEIAPDLPQIMGDSTRLRQVLLNLLSNAVKYTDAGSITLRAEQSAGKSAGKSAKKGAESITFSVIDTGIGVAPADQARIFAEFERAESGATHSRRGLGLGLAICRQLVELHQGVIGVESSGVPGRGAHFYFVLPTLDADIAGDSLPQGFTAGATADLPRTILIVDDDPGILDLNTRILRQHDSALHLVQAHDGAEAVEVMRHLRPDLLLLDLMMPELDGFGVLAAMHKQETLRTVPVVVLTAQALSDEEMARLGGGVAAVLNKGLFSAAEVIAHLERALTRTRRVGAATQRLVRQALVYIHQHHAESLSRRQIAAAVGITEDYLTQCFQQEIGITPTTYLQRYRVRRAQQLLEESDLSITDVGLTVGFTDSTYFGRIFQRETGSTPSAWRKGQRSKE